MAYGGLFKLTPGSAAAPRPRFACAPAALAFPYVRVPLMVMFPLGPQIVALYLAIGAAALSSATMSSVALRKPHTHPSG